MKPLSSIATRKFKEQYYPFTFPSRPVSTFCLSPEYK